MSHEIIYTSAPRGLKPGARGFCTVAATSGMAQPLADRLESLSGYRQAFAAHDPQARLNPVNYSHLIITVGGRKYHVLSRVADAGLDYTQRSNKFAHHVALEVNELTPAGPAWTMQQPGFFETAFSGEPRLLGVGRKPPAGAASPAVCAHWQRTTGDAGWGGVLAEAALAQPQKPVYLLFKPGQDLLPLVAEALALLPAERRWQATYSTYFTRLPPGLECQWRFLLSGSEEAKASTRLPHVTLVNLCQPLPPAQGGALVEAARTGDAPVEQAAAHPHIAPPPPLPASPSVAAPKDARAEHHDYGLTPLAPAGLSDHSGIDLSRPPQTNSRRKLLFGAFAGGMLVAVLLAAVAAKAVLNGSQRVALERVPEDRGNQVEHPTAPQAKHAGRLGQTESKQNKPKPKDKSNGSSDPPAEPDERAREAATGTETQEETARVEDSHSTAQHTASAKPVQSGSADPPAARPRTVSPFADLPDWLDVPLPGGKLDAETVLVEIPEIENPKEVSLNLLGWIGAGADVEFTDALARTEQGPVLTVEPAKGIGSVGAVTPFAEFYFDDHALRFRRTANFRRDYWLRNYLLKIDYRGFAKTFFLRAPSIVQSGKTTVAFDKTPIEIGLTDILDPYDEELSPYLQLEASVQDPAGRTLAPSAAQANDTVTIALPIQGESPLNVELHVRLFQSPASSGLQIHSFAEFPQLASQRPGNQEQRIEFSIARLDAWEQEANEKAKRLRMQIARLENTAGKASRPVASKPGAAAGKQQPTSFADRLRKDATVQEELAAECKRRRALVKKYKATLQFKLYYQVRDRQVVIAQTQDAP
ncbi:MAG TPA: hypothetical protein VHC19_09220 [Pirellulales bacterium]|nr:hypothetical protein [Pirellulales bacterium]